MSFAFLSFCAAEELKPSVSPTNPEIAKIDTRLAELAQIWKDDSAIINRLTNFKRTPVQEGTQAYYKCLESSKRIQQAEAEAKELKLRKATLEKNPASTTSDNNSVESMKITEVELSHIQIPDVVYDTKTHGPKVKELFVGMSAQQFLKISENYIAEFKRSKPTYKLEKTTVKNADGGYSVTYSSFGLGYNFMEINIDSKGTVKGFEFGRLYVEQLFKADDLKFDEFVRRFSEAYEVDLTVRIEERFNNNLQKELQSFARGITPEGVLVEIDQNMGLKMEKSTSESELKNAFN